MSDTFTRFIYTSIYGVFMTRKIKLMNNQLNIKDEIEILFEKKITKFGNGAKIDAPKEFLGKKVYVLIRK